MERAIVPSWPCELPGNTEWHVVCTNTMKDVKNKEPKIWMHPQRRCLKKYLKVTTDEDHDLGILAAYINGRDGIFLFRYAATLAVTVNVTENPSGVDEQHLGEPGPYILVVATSMAGECIWRKTFALANLFVDAAPYIYRGSFTVAFVRNQMHDDLKTEGRITEATIIKFMKNDVAMRPVARLFARNVLEVAHVRVRQGPY